MRSVNMPTPISESPRASTSSRAMHARLDADVAHPMLALHVLSTVSAADSEVQCEATNRYRETSPPLAMCSDVVSVRVVSVPAFHVQPLITRATQPVLVSTSAKFRRKPVLSHAVNDALVTTEVGSSFRIDMHSPVLKYLLVR